MEKMTDGTDDMSKESEHNFLASRQLSAEAFIKTPLFLSDPGMPRRRRPSDVARLILSAAAFVLFGWAASNNAPLDVRVLELFSDLPDWIRAISWIAYSGSGIMALSLIVMSLFSGTLGRGLLRDLFWSVFVSIALGLIGTRVVSEAWPDLIPELLTAKELPPYPTLRPMLVVIVALVLGRYVNSHAQRLLRWMTAAGIFGPLLLGITTPTAVSGSLSLGLFSVALVRLVYGSPEGLPSIERLKATLAGVGIAVADLAYQSEQPGTVGLATAETLEGTPLNIKIYGIDAESQQSAERVWRSLWYRTAGPSPRSGRSEQAQHEALAVLTARDAGVCVPAIIGVGQGGEGDVLLVSAGPLGEPFDHPDDATLRSAWRELRDLHTKARITHGGLRQESIRVLPETVELLGLSKASLFPTDQQIASDVTSMLAVQAIAAGSTRSVTAAVDVVEREVLESTLPFVQEAALEPELRKQLKAAGVEAETLRRDLAEQLGAEAPELAAVKRVKISQVFVALGAVIAANALISQVTDVGFDTLVDEVQNASLAWLVVAFLIKIASYSTEYISLKAIVTQPLPFSPTMLLQSAKSFIGLVVPSVVGSVGMNIRFLQNFGVSLTVATTQGPVIGFIGFLAEVVLLVLCAWAIGQEVETNSLTNFDAGGLIAIAIAVVVVGLVVVLAMPKFREKVVPVLREAVMSVREIVLSPSTLGRIFAGETLNKLIGALSLAATMAAFGASLPFAAVIFVSVGTGLLAGLAPVPGGIGVAEATMSGLLTASGIPAEQAVSIAIIHRVMTAYLPPIFGFFSFNWLTKQKYI